MSHDDISKQLEHLQNALTDLEQKCFYYQVEIIKILNSCGISEEDLKNKGPSTIIIQYVDALRILACDHPKDSLTRH